jgi:hypothetical protein
VKHDYEVEVVATVKRTYTKKARTAEEARLMMQDTLDMAKRVVERREKSVLGLGPWSFDQAQVATVIRVEADDG